MKTRPCVIVSPDELNANLRTFIVAPLTTEGHPYPFRVPCKFQSRSGNIVLEQIRTVDRERLVRRLGKISPSALGQALAILQEMFTSYLVLNMHLQGANSPFNGNEGKAIKPPEDLR
jgi:mRNA interferase MazF